jgi:DNA-binding LacI/PurR family transcriptional regulator
MEDVAKLAGVSRALVSLVFRGEPHVSAERRERVLNAAAELNYRPNAAARALASRTNKTLGIMLQDLHDAYFAEVFEGIAIEADTCGYRLLIGTGGRRSEDEERTVESFLEYRVDGIILVSSMIDDTTLVNISQQVPTLVTGNYIRVPSIDTVNADNQLGAELVVNYLFELGHRRIVHIDGGVDLSSQPRRVAYTTAMEELGLAPHVIEGGYGEKGGAEAAESILKMRRRPTAVFAFNDRVALGAMDRLEQDGVNFPDEMSIIGYDNTLVSSLHPINLTTVNQPREEMGRLAVTTLINRIDTHRQTAVRHTLQPSLIPRGTTRRIPVRSRARPGSARIASR